MSRSTVFLAILFFPLWWGCKKDNNKNRQVDPGYDYYPAQLGSYVEYEVEEVKYDDFFEPVKIDTFRYQLKEVLDSAFEDNSNRPSNRISRYRKDHDTLSWVLTDVWYSTKTEQRLEVIEENQRYIKLAFPLRLYKRWDGNAFNAEEEQSYFLEELGKTEQINGLSMDAVLKVVKQDEKNLIEIKYAEERYARGIGLVYRQETDLNTEISGEISSGRTFTMKIASHGMY